MANRLFPVPQIVEDKLKELLALCENSNGYLKTEDVARFLGMNSAGLRCSMERGQCPFGIAWQKDLRGNKAFKIPTATFYLWYTQGVAYK